MTGFHKNYRPVLREIAGDMARLETPEIPDSPHWVKVAKLEKIR